MSDGQDGPPEVAMRVRGLYGVVDVGADEASRAAPMARALLEGGAGVVMLRMKGAPDRVVAEVATEMVALCQGRATFILNDRMDVALAVGADGVHLGVDDLPMQAAKNITRGGFLIGRTAHDLESVRAAMQAGADYFALGPIFAAERGEAVDNVLGLDAFREIRRTANVPCVAYGGIPIARVAEIAAAQPAAIAVVAAVNGAPDVAEAARQVVRTYYDSVNRGQGGGPSGGGPGGQGGRR